MRKWQGYQKGVNLGGWLSQCNASTNRYETFIREEDIALIAEWGCDHIRVPVDYELIETESGEVIENGYTYIDRCIEWCKKYNLNMILDLHKAPGYVFDDTESSHGFFESSSLQHRFYNIWIRFAQKYGKYKDFVAFELLNEVVFSDVVEEWNRITHEAICYIRRFAPNTFIVVGGVCYNAVSSISGLWAPADERIIYNFHCYEPLLFTHQAAHWIDGMQPDFVLPYHSSLEKYRDEGKKYPSSMVGAINQDAITEIGQSLFEVLFEDAINTAEKRGVPLYCGEYGVIDKASKIDTLQWFNDIHFIFKKYSIGHAVWNYKEMDFGLSGNHYDIYSIFS